MSGKNEENVDAEYSSCHAFGVFWRITRLTHEKGNLSWSTAIFLWRATALLFSELVQALVAGCGGMSSQPPDLNAAALLSRPQQI